MAFNLILAVSSLVLAVLVALTVQIFYFSPIDPILLEIPPASSASPSTKNNQLQNVIKLGEGLLKDPEDVCVDKEGTLYTATRDGWIKRLRRNENWENWKHIDSNTLLGITPTKGGIIVCDTIKGLLKVTEDGFSVLVSHVNGSQIREATCIRPSPSVNQNGIYPVKDRYLLRTHTWEQIAESVLNWEGACRSTDS